MMILDRLKSAARGWSMSDTAGLVRKSLTSMQTWELPAFADYRGPSARQVAIEGLVRNAIVYACVKRIADAASAVPVYVEAAGGYDKRDDLHPALACLMNPQGASGSVDGVDFLGGVYADTALHGEAFIARLDSGWNATTPIDRLRVDRVSERLDKRGDVMAWEYAVGNGADKSVTTFHRSGRRKIAMQIKGYNPVDDYRGLSPIVPAAFGVDVHNDINRSTVGLLRNQGRPSGAVQYGGDMGMTEDQFERLRSELDSFFGNSRNNGRPLLLDGGLSWVSMGLTPADAMHIEQAAKAAREIALSLGVPPMLLGIPGDNTYSNYQEARLAFYHETIMPLVRRVLSRLTMWMIWQPESFGGQSGDRSRRFMADWDQVPAIAEYRLAMMERRDKIEMLSIDEKRREGGWRELGVAGSSEPMISGVRTLLSEYGAANGDDD